jgi:hypothetical protein
MAVHAKLIFSRYLDVVASDLLTIKSISLSTYRRLSYTIPNNNSFFAEIICIADLGASPTNNVNRVC